MMIYVVIGLAIATAVMILIFRGGHREHHIGKYYGQMRRVLYISRSTWLAFLKFTRIKDTTCMAIGETVFGDRPWEEIPENFVVHENGHVLRYRRVVARYPQFDHFGLRWIWRVIFVGGYFSRNEDHEAEADRIMIRYYEGALPYILELDAAFLKRCAKAQWGR